MGLDMSTDQDELYEGLIGYAIEHMCLFYHSGDVNNLDDLVELAEQVHQFSVLLGDVSYPRCNSAFYC